MFLILIKHEALTPSIIQNRMFLQSEGKKVCRVTAPKWKISAEAELRSAIGLMPLHHEKSKDVLKISQRENV